MKRLIFCILICCLLLHGCGKTDPNMWEQAPIPFDQRSFGNMGFLETDFADYCVMWPETGNLAFIHVAPKGSDTFVPLCSKPNCTHDTSDCHAACIPGGGLGYCGQRLYTIDDNGGYGVVSMRPDGTDRQSEGKIPDPVHSDGTQGGSYQFTFHEKWLLILYDPSENLPLEEQVERFYVMDLQTGAMQEPFQGFFTEKVSIGGIICPVGSLIYAEAYFRDDSGAVENWWISMDMETGTVKKLLACENPVPFQVEDGVFYYQLPGGSFMEYDLKTGKTTDRGLPVPEAVGSMKIDGDLIYTFTNDGSLEKSDFTMYFLNRDYEVLDQIRLGEGVRPFCVDKEYCYFVATGSTKLCYRLQKSKIGTGQLALLPI